MTGLLAALPDLNGDGKTDIIWYSAASGQTIAWLMNGNTLAGGGLFLSQSVDSRYSRTNCLSMEG